MKKLVLTAFSCISAMTIDAQQLAFDWVGAFRGLNSDLGHAIKIDAQGNMITTGSFEQDVDMNPGTAATQIQQFNSNGESDIFISKLGPQGNYIWALQIGGAGDDAGFGICPLPVPGIALTGRFSGNVDFVVSVGGSMLPSAGQFDAFALSMNDSGALLWLKQFGSTGWDVGRGVSADDQSNMYLVGEFSNTVSFYKGNTDYTINTTGEYGIIF